MLKLIDDTSCKLFRMTTAKDAEDREKCPDPRVSTENLMTGTRALNRLAALPNFMDIQCEDRDAVCDLFDSFQTAHAAIADAFWHPCFPGSKVTPKPIPVSAKTLHAPPHQVANTSPPLMPGRAQFHEAAFAR